MYRKCFWLLAFCLVAGLVSSASAAWTGVTVGDDLPLGSNSYDAATDTWTVQGDGHDIWDSADDFRYVYRYLTGDGSLSARVVSMTSGSSTWAKAGVMMRETLAGESRHAMQVVTAGDGNGASFQQRQATGGGGTNTDAGSTITKPYYVKIERIGDGFNGYLSPDGVTWTQQGSTVTMPLRDKTGTIAGCYIGLCVTSHTTGELVTAKFDHVVVTGNVTDSPPPLLKAWNPNPPNGAMNLSMPLFQWTKGDTAIFHDVYFGTSPDEMAKVASHQPFAMYYHMQPLEPGTKYYWRVDEIDATGTIYQGDVWNAMATPLTAYLPVPADGAEDVSAVGSVSWTSGKAAAGHHVFFSDKREDVENGAAAADKGKIDLATTSFDPNMLRGLTNYYWRVDEVQADGSELQGPVWSFTTIGGNKIIWQWWLGIAGTAVSDLTNSPNYPANPTGFQLVDAFESPADWGDNYGQRLFGWLTPPEDGDYTFWIAGDDEQQLWLSTDENPANVTMIATVPGWTPYRDFDNTNGGAGDAAQQRSDPIALKAGQKYYIEALGKEGGGGDSTSVAWQRPGSAREVLSAQYVTPFVLPPLRAYGPKPDDGAVEVLQSPTLTWGAGDKAEQHEVYFGEDPNAVAAADSSSDLFKGSQAEASFAPGDLEWNKTYYWRVDEVAGGDPDSPWKGDVWSFTTANFQLVDDMEGYTDNEGSRIFDIWIDGWATGTNGSTVGNIDPPFAEQTIVHGGKQSMPMDYNNVNSPYYSEAELELIPIQNWTANEVTDLSLWFRGRPPTFAEAADGTITMGGSGHDIWDNADDFRFAYKRVSGNASIVVKVESIGNTNTWAKAGVMIRQSLDGGSKFTYTVVTPGQGVSFGWRETADGGCNSATQAGIPAPQWVKLTRTGDAFTAQYSADGTTWTDIKNADGTVTSTTVAMTGSVYIGLCVTSHDAALVTSGVFTGPSTTGNVTGSWQVAEIGDDPEPANSPQTLYVVVEDSAGKSKVVSNPDPGAVTVTAWTEWKIPLSDITGVNLSKVKKLYIGVGDRKNPVADGAGRIYIDDIRVVKPAEAPQP